MIPSTWLPHRRASDGEHVGYLVPHAPGVFVPVTLIGTVLGAPGPLPQASALLDAHGLAALAGRWWCVLPDVLTQNLTDLSQPDPSWSPRPVRIVEVGTTGCSVRLEFPGPDERAVRVRVRLPATDHLRAG